MVDSLQANTHPNPPDPTSLTRPADHPEESTLDGPPFHPMAHFHGDDFGCDSSCSTPYVSAPSSPGRPGPGPGPGLGGFFYSCPPSPMHFSMMGGSFSASSSPPRELGGGGCNEFEFLSGGLWSGSGATGSSTMSSADELFLNGQIRPMKLSTHLESPQVLDPLVDLDDEGPTRERRGREVRNWSKSRSRRTRSMSPLRSSSSFGFLLDEEEEEAEGRVKMESFCDGSRKVGDLGMESGCIGGIGKENGSRGGSDSGEGTTSRSSSAGRNNSRRWEFLKDFLYRSKSEGRSSNSSSNNKFWSNISFSPGKDRKSLSLGGAGEKVGTFVKEKGSGGGGGSGGKGSVGGGGGGKKPVNGGVAGKRRGSNVSAHEMHYKASRAQAEEMRKRTFLPYRQGLLGCLGFSSKGYGAMNGFARALNPVSSR